MKIFYVYRAIAHYRGMERIFVDKMNSLVRLYGYDVTLVTADQGSHPMSYPLDAHVRHVDMAIRFHQSLRYNLLWRPFVKVRLQYRFVCRLKKLIADIQPDILVCNTDVFPNLVMMAKGKLPLVVESHSLCRETLRFSDSLRWKLLRWYTLRNLRHARVIVALTEGDAAEWRRFNRDVRSITNVVHLNTTGHACDISAKRVIFASRFSQQKGIPYLIEIWKRVHARYPDWELHVYGDGELRVQYQPQLESLGANVVVHDATSDVFHAYLSGSVFLLTSVFEPFGLVLPEAMSCGLPVVAFDCDFGPREIISNGVDGFLVPAFDIDAYVDRVCQLMSSAEQRRSMGQAGMRNSQRYAPEHMMVHWKSLFEELIKEERP